MPDNAAPTPPELPQSPIPPQVSGRQSHLLLYGCGGLLALLLLIVATVAITIWWIQRPIKPVVLSAREKAVVDQKLQRLEDASPHTAPQPNNNSRAPGSTPVPRVNAPPPDVRGQGVEQD